MNIDFSKVDWHGLAKKIKALRVTGLRKNMHTHNSLEFQRLARELDDAVGSTRFQYFEAHTEKYVVSAGRDYDVNTGKELEQLALFARSDLARALQDWHRDYLTGKLN